MCWSPIPRSPTPWSARRSAPTSSAPRSARPTSCSSMPRASRSRPMTSRSSATSTACAPRCGTRCRGIQIEGVGDGVMLTGSVSSPIEAQQAGDLAARLVGGADKVVNSIVGPRPRPGDAEGHCRGSAARHHQADGRRSQRQHELRHRGGEFQQQQSVHRLRPPAGLRQRPGVSAPSPRDFPRSPPPCARWKAPAWCERWPNPT